MLERILEMNGYMMAQLEGIKQQLEIIDNKQFLEQTLKEKKQGETG